MTASDFEQFEGKELQHSEIKQCDVTSVVRFCTKCGSRIEDDNRFCTECGFPVEVETEDNHETDEEKIKYNNREFSALSVSSDRIKAALEHRNIVVSNNKNLEKRKLFEISDNLYLISKKKNAKHSILGYYVFKNQERTEYLVIKNVEGSKVTGYLTEKFSDNSYGNESFEGTLQENAIVLKVNGWDLHPAPQKTHTEYSSGCITKSIEQYTIRKDISFLGAVRENEISGIWFLEDGKLSITYTKT